MSGYGNVGRQLYPYRFRSLESLMARILDAVERFHHYAMPEPNSGCWLWTGTIEWHGYGRICVKTKHIYAHRFAYSTFRQAVPVGLELHHRCHNRACVNPDHLETIDPAHHVHLTLHETAVLRSNFKRNQTHCMRGHPLSDENLRITKRGQRACKTCARDRSAKKYAATRILSVDRPSNR